MKKGRGLQITAFFLVFLFYLIPASAEVYKYTDENGILFFTDNTDKIPEGQRHTAERVETDEGLFHRWINLPVSRVVLILFLLIVIIFFARYFFGRSFPRILMTLLVILLIGTMIYSIFAAWKGRSATRPFETVVEPYLPSPAPINKAKEQVKRLGEDQKRQEEIIDSLKDTEKQ